MNTNVIHKLSDQNPLGRLSDDQKNLLDDWLFLKKLEPLDVVKILREQWNVQVRTDQVEEYRRVQTHNRRIKEPDTANPCECTGPVPDKPGGFYQEMLEAIDRCTDETSRVDDFDKRMRYMIQFLRLKIQLRRAEIQERNHILARESWEFDIVRQCFQHRELMEQVRKDPGMDEEQKINRIRHRLFGEAADTIQDPIYRNAGR